MTDPGVEEQIDRRLEEIDELRENALEAIAASNALDELEALRVSYTGRKSRLKELYGQLGNLGPDGSRRLGQRLNAFQEAFEVAFRERKAELEQAATAVRLQGEQLDLTRPPRRLSPGRAHLITQVTEEIVDAFIGLGYRVAEGPEIESATYNFDLLNIPVDHPARQEMDTVYVGGDGGVVLRTHTSPVQARVMLTQPPPIAVVVPGRCYRNDTPDATHYPVFHQVEGLLVASGVTMADLRGTLSAFARALFGPDREVRLRPSFFPFTEPSAEVDVSCAFCSPDAQDCRVCSGTGWIELLGSGMVDPNVLEACGLDPTEVSGFAFGIGVERVATMRHDVDDIRTLYENDARFLEAL